MNEQVSRLAKSAVVLYVTLFRLIMAKRVKHWSRAWDRKTSYCELWRGRSDESHASKSSLEESKLFVESKIDADFWSGQRLSKNLFWRPVSMCPFQNGSSTCGILNKSTVSAKFTCDDLCGESESYWERVMWWYFAQVWKHCVWLVVDSFIGASNVVNCVISWSCWQTDFRYVVALVL